MRKTIVSAIFVGAVVFATIALAQTTTTTVPAGTVVEVGSGLAGQIRDIMMAIAGGVISALGGWVAYWIKAKFGIDIEAKHREALQAFLTRQASALLALGAVKLEGLKVDVKSEALASVAHMAFTAIPDAMKYFNLTPDIIGAMIVDLIPKQESVAKAQAVALDTQNPQTPDAPAKGVT
jgi:hypothetical protein